jgi:hypothetical protein
LRHKNKAGGKDSGILRIEEMVVNLGNAEKKNEELKKEITALKQIQNNQSKALQKMVFQNDYP